MQLDEFSYELPEALIAQVAPPDRTASRLMVVDRSESAPPQDARFHDLPRLLDEGDVLVVNRTRVVPARLFLRRETGGRTEILFIRRLGDETLLAWIKSIRRLKPGERLQVDGGDAVFRFVEQSGDREGILGLEEGSGAIDDVLEAAGHVPLPPYIRREDRPEDRARYQTVFAKEPGSVAAPTAGLHFDTELIAALERRGVEVLSLLLHVGPGTFSPLDHDTVEANQLDAEHFEIARRTIDNISGARRQGKRIVAVGTTVARALESAHAQGWFDGEPRDRVGETNLFIYPGYKFSMIDRLITNFHLPKSSLLMLVCAFAGTEHTLACYQAAVERDYRFYSYGDAMLIR